jgi:hypothetical protein
MDGENIVFYKERKMNTDKDTSRSTELSLRTAAIVAGLGLLVMAILAAFANFSVIQNLVVAGDAKTTAANIVASAGSFRMGITFFLITAILDVVVAWALYILLKPVNKSLSVLAAWFRIVYAAIFTVVLTNLFNVLLLLNGSDYLKVFEPDQLYAQAMLSLGAFRAGWDIGIVIFGLHLLVLGYLVIKSGYAPKWLGFLFGILLIIAGLGYMVDSFGKFLLPNYNASIAQFTFIGEVVLIFWLLWKGIKGFGEKLQQK